MKTLKTFAKIFYKVVLVVLILLALLITVSMLPIPGSYKLMSVMSGSMNPTIKVGSLIVVQPVDNYETGDVISFRPRNVDSNRNTTTHRIVEKRVDQYGITELITKGDANSSNDSEKTYKYQIVGKYLFGVPYAGYIIAGIKTLPGLMLIILVPAVIIVYEEMKNIKKEAEKIIKKKKRLNKKKISKEKAEKKVKNEKTA